jgi:hypothetical protein
VVVALNAEGVFGRQQRAVDPTRYHAAKAEETAHLRRFYEYAMDRRIGRMGAEIVRDPGMWN